MSLIFADGFDNYDVLTDLWDAVAGGTSIVTTPGAPRTGIGCLSYSGLSGFLGATKSLGHIGNMLIATNWNSQDKGPVMFFGNSDGAPGYNGVVISVEVLADGNVRVINRPAAGTIELGRTASPGLVQLNTYVSIACQCICDPTAGEVVLWINGFEALHLTGKNTASQDNPALHYYNRLSLVGPDGGANAYHDDFYALDCGTSPNTTFLGALRLYALPPTADASVMWTPKSVGENWSQVNEVPPDGDTSYVSSGGVGDQDQYVYPGAGVPIISDIKFCVHELDMRADVGSESVASVVNGAINPTAVALASTYHIYPANYDVNPATGVAFVTADFPIQAGPRVIATS